MNRQLYMFYCCYMYILIIHIGYANMAPLVQCTCPIATIVSTCVHMKVRNPKAKLHVCTYTKSYSVHVHTHAQTSPHLAGVLWSLPSEYCTASFLACVVQGCTHSYRGNELKWSWYIMHVKISLSKDQDTQSITSVRQSKKHTLTGLDGAVVVPVHKTQARL